MMQLALAFMEPERDAQAETALADDLLEGAHEIGRFIWGESASDRKFYRVIATSRLPVFRIGNRYHARKSRLMAWIREQEDRSIGRL